MIEIKYNSIDLFSGLSPLPYIGIGEESVFYNNRWALVDKITLEGQLTGICNGIDYLQAENDEFIQTEDDFNLILSEIGLFEKLNNSKNALIYRLSKGFQEFSVIEDGVTLYSNPSARVTNIQFGESNWSTLVPYTIELEAYRSGLFSGYFGVINPVNEFSFERGEDGIVDLVHTCSAQGVKVSNSSSIQNAKNYVSTISGWSQQVLPLFNGAPNTGIILKSVEENVDRFNGVYSISERYRYDPLNATKGLLRYTVSLESGDAGESSVSINGTLEGGENTTVNDLRSKYSGISFYNLANSVYSGTWGGNLNTYPDSLSFTEDSFAKVIEFSISYTDNEYPNPYLIDNTSISIDQLGESSITVDVVAKWRGQCLCNSEYGWNQINAVLNAYNFLGEARSKWDLYGKTSQLNSVPSSVSVTENKSNCEKQISYTYDEAGETVSGLDFFYYTIDVSPAIPVYASTPVIPVGQYSITRLNYDRRARVTIAGQAKVANCLNVDFGISRIKSKVNQLSNIHVKGIKKVLESASISQGENPNLISFNFTWSSEAAREINLSWG